MLVVPTPNTSIDRATFDTCSTRAAPHRHPAQRLRRPKTIGWSRHPSGRATHRLLESASREAHQQPPLNFLAAAMPTQNHSLHHSAKRRSLCRLHSTDRRRFRSPLPGRFRRLPSRKAIAPRSQSPRGLLLPSPLRYPQQQTQSPSPSARTRCEPVANFARHVRHRQRDSRTQRFLCRGEIGEGRSRVRHADERQHRCQS